MRRAAALLALATGLTGCGLIYHHTILPATNDFHATPVLAASPATSNAKRISYSYYFDVRWDSNAIGDIAKAHGISPIYYADVEELRILGIWHQTWLIVYGESAESGDAESALEDD